MNKPVIIGNATLYLGDCLEILPTLPKVNAVITDPPYGVGIEYGGFVDTRDSVRALAEAWFPLAREVSARVCLTPGILGQWLYPEPTWVLSWYSPNSSGFGKWGFSCWQPILVYGKDPSPGPGKQPDAFAFYELEKRIDGHPCPKPVGLMKRIVGRTSSSEEKVLDPFMGSGTTGVACMNLGRKFIGIEIEPKYFDIACERIENAQRQVRMFE